MVNEKEEIFTNITADGGIKKRILRKGKGTFPFDGNEIQVNFIFKNQDNDIVFQIKDKPLIFKIGHQQIIEELEFCVKTMKLGEKAEFIFYPKYKIFIKNDSGKSLFNIRGRIIKNRNSLSNIITNQ